MVETVNVQEEFDNEFTREFGFPNERPAKKVKAHLMDNVKEFITRSPFLVMATSNPDGECDASPKGGMPGWVKIVDDTHLLIPDVAGNNLFQSYINMSENPHVGLVFFIPGIRETVRVNGKVSIVNKDKLARLQAELEVSNSDDNSRLQQGILVEVEEAYGHCPRALAFSDVWDVEQIEANRPKRAAR